VPVARRPDIDRWILSDLQILVQLARREFERFNLMTFCLEAEKFVDERLSNWYVRRNRRRFWKAERSEDKLAAYQTLHTVLLTLTKLFAPIIPFLTETMYQNLVAGANRPASVHLCDYPEVDEDLIDPDLSADMDALLRLVSLGSAARNSVKIKVRQALAEIRVQPGDERERRAVERFAAQINDELNIKRVVLHDPTEGPLLRPEVKANPKTLGPKLGARMKDVLAALSRMSPSTLAEKFQAGQALEVVLPEGPVTLEPVDIFVHWRAAEGWAGVADRATQIAIDARITEELAQEGMAREVVRHVQELRKTANLEPEDRIELYLQTESARLRQAITTHQQYICNETLAVHLTAQPIKGPNVHRATVKVDGQPLTIELRKKQ
jgi:isoleucyl-tRNA synthetase